MFQCEIAQSISSALTAPIENGPTPRWKRKSSCQSMDERMNMSQNRTSTPSLSRMAKTPSKTPSRTPSKSSKTPTTTPSKFSSAGDRFIPNRSAMDFDNSHYKLVHEWPSSSTGSPSKKEEERRLKENFDPNLSKSKIMSFKVKAPLAEGHLSSSKVLFSQNVTPAGPRKNKNRYIPQVPERILDAPDYMNDYYLNLIDWSSGSHLAVALANNVYIWDSKTGNIVHLCELNSANSYISSVKWEKANGYLAIGTSDSNVQLWDVEKSTKLRQMSGHASRVGSLSWNSHILSSGSRSGAIHHHDVRIVDHQVGVLTGHSQEVCGLEWSPDGKYLASGGNDNLLNIWDSALQDSRTPLHSLSQHTAGVKAIAWCPWQNSILASGGGSADRCIKFWNANTGACLNSVDTKSQVCGILWSKKYKELISGHGYSQNQLTIWKYPSMTKVIDLNGHTSRILQLTMSPDETFVMSAAADETLRLWKVFPTEEKKKAKTPSKEHDSVSVFKFR